MHSVAEARLSELGERTFVLADQMAFADFSGDWNPIHVDPLYARRCLTGQVVVHGIHVLLWALECWARDGGIAGNIVRLHAQFIRPILLGEHIVCRLLEEKGALVKLEVSVPAGEAMQVEFAIGESRRAVVMPAGGCAPPQKSPVRLSIEDLPGRSGAWVLEAEDGRPEKLFPFLVNLLGDLFPVMLAHTSRLVGMECPGLHSLYSELDLVASSDAEPDATHGLDYQVLRTDRRFSLVSMQVRGAGMSGIVRAFLRPPPFRQASMQDMKGHVPQDVFSGQRALVVGGSRGLGELTAKLLAAGGAEVCITYHRGRSEAESVREEIVTHGGKATVAALDVQISFDPEMVLAEGWRPTHLYYFATPFIFSGDRAGFSSELLAQFSVYYVTGFAQLVESLCAAGLQAAFYPSTVALDELPADMAEYCAAKAAGEILCQLLIQRHPGLQIHYPRLPRLVTDQTASLLPVKNLDPLPVMLNLLNTFAATQRSLPAGANSAV